mgnify:CR=1 FL=1
MPGDDAADIRLELGDLSPFRQLAWLSLACSAAVQTGCGRRGAVHAGGLHAGVAALVERSDGRWPLDGAVVGDPMTVPAADEAFAFITGARALTVKLVTYMTRLHVEPGQTEPVGVDPRIFWAGAGDTGVLSRLRWLVDALGDPAAAEAFANYAEAFGPAERTVSILTSVFRGDEFLDGFLANSGELDGYGNCEHFLIRPGSPGDEHARLLAHVRAYPSAIYINLPHDPGLYETWNLAARLSTARYLSNANLDDRRSPAHVRALSARLDADDDIDVASSALRVTDVPNLEWPASAGCMIWYADTGDRNYTGEELLQPHGNGYRSRNMPHCMPVWRRWLHARYGYFDERANGPSADWAFWLRIGAYGHRFGLVSVPLGLYLRNPDSYWHRESVCTAEDTWDRRIAARYAPNLREGAPFSEPPVPIALAMRTLGQLAACGAWLELIAYLDHLRERTAALPSSATSRRLVDRLERYYLGGAVGESDAPSDSVAQPGAGWLNGLERRLIERFRSRFFFDCAPGHAGDRILIGAAIDLYTATAKPAALLLLALRHRRLGEADAEYQILAAVQRRHPAEFWPALQSVYRFEADLDELAGRLGLAQIPAQTGAAEATRLRLCFFPDCTASNAYQDHLYAGLRNAGASVTAITDPEDLWALQRQEECDNVVHIHWINAFFRSVPSDRFVARSEAVLAGLADLQARGFRIDWTVHNALSHECVNPRAEAVFRQRLARQVDRVYVHHPMVREELDWLPADCPVWLSEHGPYETGPAGRTDRSIARERLGLPQGAFVVVCPGKVREYKGLDDNLPIVRKVMDARPDMHLVIAGAIESQKPREELSRLPQDRLIAPDRALSAEEFELYLRAADFVLLSYRSILTSGAMFHTLSLGVPVLAPRLGTIPAYIVDGWNGYTYSDAQDLERLLYECSSAPLPATLAKNAARTAQRLRWRFG